MPQQQLPPVPPTDHPDPKDLIWIREATTLYNRSEEWFYSQMQARQINRYGFPGDRRTYVLRQEVEAAIRPRPLDQYYTPPPTAE